MCFTCIMEHQFGYKNVVNNIVIPQCVNELLSRCRHATCLQPTPVNPVPACQQPPLLLIRCRHATCLQLPPLLLIRCRHATCLHLPPLLLTWMNSNIVSLIHSRLL